MYSRYVIGVLPVLLFVEIYALEYNILENLEMACPFRDNCTLIEQHGTKFEARSCECDNLCNDFRDCCIDKANPDTLTLSRNYSCMTFGEETEIGVYVVDSCPQSYTVSKFVRSLCQEKDDFTDPLVSAPVTVISTDTTFKNRYCAECSGAAPSSLMSWMVHLNCDAIDPTLNSTQLRPDESSIWQKLKYNFKLGAWAFELDEESYICEVIFDKPDNLSAVRLCRANTIDNCPSSFLNPKIKRLCESYSAVVYDSENSYKNPHCAICNNRRVEDLSCLDPESFIRSAKLRFQSPMRLDANPRNGTEAAKFPLCPTGERYDPFLKKCREIICTVPGYKMVDGVCRKDC